MIPETPPVTMVRHRVSMAFRLYASDNSQTTRDPAAEGGPRLLAKRLRSWLCVHSLGIQGLVVLDRTLSDGRDESMR